MKGAAAAAARTDLNIIVSSKIYLRNDYPQMMDQVRLSDRMWLLYHRAGASS